MAARPYDRERDDTHPLEEIVELHHTGHLHASYVDGLMGHCASLSSALELLIDGPTDPTAQQIGRAVLAEFNRWMAETNRQVAVLEGVH